VSRRAIAVLVVAGVALLAVYWFAIRTKTAEPHVQVPQLAATIGEGDETFFVRLSGLSGPGGLPGHRPLISPSSSAVASRPSKVEPGSDHRSSQSENG